MEVKCKTQDYLDLHELTEFQGGLKERDDKDYAYIWYKQNRTHTYNNHRTPYEVRFAA